MLIGLLSDPHANLPAVEAVLTDVETAAPDVLVCLGDFVGYGAQPNEVVEALRDRCSVCLAGNHDLAALGRLDVAAFNPFAAASVAWTADHLAGETERFLAGLGSRTQFEGIDLAHASLRDPVNEYVFDEEIAQANFDADPFEVAVVGHTHVPRLFVQAGEQVLAYQIEEGLATDPTGGGLLGKIRLLINPGSIGQPRDGDPRASWGIWDTEGRSLRLRRVWYDVEQAQSSIRAAGLPDLLADRLAAGW
ncbi:MAG: metallophosphoesterase family protein [Actinomycetota bacterium]